MQSGPEIHTYADQWGDIRGRTIFPNEAPRVYLNRGDEAPGFFVDVSDAVGLTHKDNARGVLLADLDTDGDLDVVMANQHGRALTYKNTRRDDPHAAHFVCVRPRGDGVHSHRSGIGTRLSVTRDGVVSLAEATLMAGFSAQREPMLRIGLGAQTTPTMSVTLRFPGGADEVYEVPTDRCVTVLQGQGVVESR